MTSEKKLFIIDCDAGVDDAESIIFALSQAENGLQVLAITCVDGNTSLDKVTGNVLRVLKLCKRQEIPVYRGAEGPLVGTKAHRAENIHGGDGLGGMAGTVFLDSGDRIQEETAPSALIRLIRQHPGMITLVATGPMTNLVLAQRCWGRFGSNLKELIIMGGDCTARGNRRDLVTAEFNFGIDPESASIVLKEFECPMHIVPYDACKTAAISWDWHASWISGNNTISQFLAKMHETLRKGRNAEAAAGGASAPGYYSCDLYAMVYALDRSTAENVQRHYVNVECQGSFLTRGMLVIDRRGVTGNLSNATLITELNMQKLKSHLLNMVQTLSYL